MSKKPTEPDDWSSRSEALFRAARDAHAPTATDRERVRSALAHKVAAASGAPSTDDGPARLADSGMSRAAVGKLTKIGVGAAFALATAAAFMRTDDSRERTEPKSVVQAPSSGGTQAARATQPAVAVGDSPATSNVAPASAATGARSKGTQAARPAARRSVALSTPAVMVPGPSPEPSQARPVEQPVSAEPLTRLPTRIDTPVNSAENTIDARAELEFVARINAAVRTSAPEAVLALCAEHERRWPQGMFEQEREGARAIASCASKLAGAGARARAFLANYPRTAIAARVREECAPALSDEDIGRRRQPVARDHAGHALDY